MSRKKREINPLLNQPSDNWWEKKTTPLEALDELITRLYPSENNIVRAEYDIKIIRNALKDYERRLALAKEYNDPSNVGKRLLALEVIKQELPNMLLVRNSKDYNHFLEIGSDNLTKEQYDLLKEVLL